MSDAPDIAPPAPLHFSTDRLAPRSAFDTYHAFYSVGADMIRDGEDFRAVVTSRRFHRMIVHERQLRAVRHVREAARVRHTDFSHFTATLCLSGTIHADDGGGYRRIRAGEIMLLDIARPTRTAAEDGRILTVALGREILDGIVGDAGRLHGRLLGAADAAPLAAYLLGLVAREDEDLGLADPTLAVDRLLENVIAPGRPAARLRAQRLSRAYRLIETHLDDPALEPDTLAAALGLSRATLYRLFEPLGGIRRHIVERRLRRLRRLLGDARRPGNIADLAAQAGLQSESHASRAFLDRFALRPGRLRQRLLHATGAERAMLQMEILQDEVR